MSIKVSNVTKLYGKQFALDNISFEIRTGEIVGFLGPNGAGKSTMMKIITGFIPPTSGLVEVNGLNIEQNSLEVLKNVGYLPEHNPLYLDMYVREYLEFVAGLYKLGRSTRSRIDEMIEKTGLTVEQRKKIGELSKGYRQRVGLAQTLIHDPKVLILDEPTTGLDPNQIIEIRNLISEIGKEKTIMLSTHIMQEVEAICDTVIIINQGKIVAADSASDIISHTKKMQTVVLELDNDVDIEKIEALDGVEKVGRIGNKSWAIQSLVNVDVRPVLFKFAVDNSLTVLSMQKEKISLEQVFQELTKN